MAPTICFQIESATQVALDILLHSQKSERNFFMAEGEVELEVEHLVIMPR